jgi:glucose-6-phosphate isomerase
LGATDQHSQVQLYREGPNDKIFTIIEVADFKTRLRIPRALGQIEKFRYLHGKTMNQLMAAELLGTMDALKISRRPVSKITLSEVNENTVAQLLYMLEVETAMAGRLYNVQTFDQPAVQTGKLLATAILSNDKAALRKLYNEEDV